MRTTSFLQEGMPIAMPLPLFLRSPQPDNSPRADGSPASQPSSRFGLHSHVRSIINGSSVYSSSPNPSNNSNSPKPSFLGFLRRDQSPPAPIDIPDNNEFRALSESRSPLRPQHTARSYMRAMPTFMTPRMPDAVHEQYRHPADVPLSYLEEQEQEHPHEHSRSRSLDPETQQLQDEVHGRRHRRRRRHRGDHHHHHRRRKHRHGHSHGSSHSHSSHSTHWRRSHRRRPEHSICFGMVKTQAARSKLFACLISGLFLLTVLAVYLALALTRGRHPNGLGQEIHILFILSTIAILIVFTHSFIRLLMLALRPPQETPLIPEMNSPEGFRPIRPIRVVLARDEELADAEENIGMSSPDVDNGNSDDPEKEAAKKIVVPPPAYGLWRSSVRVDPNLLHWQRVEPPPPPPPAASAQPSPTGPPPRNSLLPNFDWESNPPSPMPPQAEANQAAPRPPSYVSEDGVSYVVEAAPRSTVVRQSHTGVSDIHPAWRPGYAVSSVGSVWPAPLRV